MGHVNNCSESRRNGGEKDVCGNYGGKFILSGKHLGVLAFTDLLTRAYGTREGGWSERKDERLEGNDNVDYYSQNNPIQNKKR